MDTYTMGLSLAGLAVFAVVVYFVAKHSKKGKGGGTAHKDTGNTSQEK